MVRKQRLYLVGVNQRYGENVYIPYSVGLLYAYARTFPEIVNAYDMCGFLYLKEPIEEAVARIIEPDIIGISAYIWNFEWNKAFARAVKERWPDCTILVGGVQVPDESTRILDENAQFDFAIYGEGEGAFADFLREHTQETQDYSRLGSLIYRSIGGDVRVTARRPFVPLEELRSPYLEGAFDDIWPLEPRWQILHETNRGCMYECSMCAWGQATLSKLRLFPEERVRREIEWFGRHQVDYVDNADANAGVVKRDIDFAKLLGTTKAKHGYPKTFRTSFAKNSNDVVWAIANILHDANMLKSVTLALQSLDSDVLVNIKRKNIKFDKFADLVKRYADAGIPTYTELILGLPGETLDTFLDGIERCLVAGQHQGVFVYNNLMLENTEQNTSEYRQAHGLRSVSLEAMLTHGTPTPGVPRERQEIVIETSTMSHEHWKRGYLYGKVIEVFHAQGLLQHLAITLHERYGARYRDFYMEVLDWCLEHPWTVAGREICGIRDVLERALAGGSWDCVDPRLGEISWPPEEFAFARICCELDKFYDEICDSFVYASQGPSVEERMKLLEEQRSMIVGPEPGREAEWAREVVWYSRKGTAARKRRERLGDAA